MQVGSAHLDISDASKCFPHLTKAFLLLQLFVYIAHFADQNWLGDKRLVWMSTKVFFATAIVCFLTDNFRNVSMRWPVLLSNNRSNLLHGLFVFRVVIISVIRISADISYVILKPLPARFTSDSSSAWRDWTTFLLWNIDMLYQWGSVEHLSLIAFHGTNNLKFNFKL